MYICMRSWLERELSRLRARALSLPSRQCCMKRLQEQAVPSWEPRGLTLDTINIDRSFYFCYSSRFSSGLFMNDGKLQKRNKTNISKWFIPQFSQNTALRYRFFVTQKCHRYMTVLSKRKEIVIFRDIGEALIRFELKLPLWRSGTLILTWHPCQLVWSGDGRKQEIWIIFSFLASDWCANDWHDGIGRSWWNGDQ